jgi:hypothetical protein
LTYVNFSDIIYIMYENPRFLVDSSGETTEQELHEANPQRSPTLRIGNDIVVGPGGATPTPEQIGGSRYFVEAGGRIIDTQTGEAVTHGDGTNSINIGKIREQEDK